MSLLNVYKIQMTYFSPIVKFPITELLTKYHSVPATLENWQFKTTVSFIFAKTEWVKVFSWRRGLPVPIKEKLKWAIHLLYYNSLIQCNNSYIWSSDQKFFLADLLKIAQTKLALIFLLHRNSKIISPISLSWQKWISENI